MGECFALVQQHLKAPAVLDSQDSLRSSVAGSLRSLRRPGSPRTAAPFSPTRDAPRLAGSRSLRLREHPDRTAHTPPQPTPPQQWLATRLAGVGGVPRAYSGSRRSGCRRAPSQAAVARDVSASVREPARGTTSGSEGVGWGGRRAVWAVRFSVSVGTPRCCSRSLSRLRRCSRSGTRIHASQHTKTREGKPLDRLTHPT